MRRSLAVLFFALLILAVPASAATIIVGSSPSMWADPGPFGNAYAGEYQQLYANSAFPGPVVITGLEFYNTYSYNVADHMNSGAWTISLSTSAATNLTLSNVPGNNIGGDNTQVFSGDLYQPWAWGDTLTIGLSTPFSYNPSNGNC